jgi:NaMN:DMB phosphoribosyltransferase
MDLDNKHTATETEEWIARARNAIDEKAKPKGSLGKLEDWAVRYAPT